MTLQWDKSIDDPYLQSYKVYYYTTAGNIESLNPEDYAVSYTLAEGGPVALSAGDPKPITIDKENTQITLRFADNSRDYYFTVTAVDTRSLEGIPTPEIICKTLMVVKAGTGAGTVTATPAGLHCGSTTCTANFMSDTTVTLTAVPDAGHAFTGWSGGGCSGTGSCVVNVTSSVTVTAMFLPLLDLVKGGTGTGTVTGSPAGIASEINCGAACVSDSAAFNLDTAVTLTATPDAGNVFADWLGSGCPSTGPCVVTMSAPQSVTATFLPLRRLSVLKAGTGRGNITGAPAGIASEINCGTGCASDSADFAEGTPVTLTAIPDSGYAFTGWSNGECSGTTACVLTMDAVKSVTATFATYRMLSVTKAGTGTGTVTGTPAGISSEIDCGTGCASDSANYSTNTVVTLTAAADSGHTFSGWSGACSGTDPCAVTMSAAKTVTATFLQEPHTITATAGANGTISPAGVTTVNHGASQTYTITANAGYHITDVTVDGASVGAVTSYTFTAVTANHTIAATFAVNTYALGVSRNGTGTGLVTSNPAGIACGADCAETFNYGTTVTLTAAADASSTWTGWSGACSGASPTCTLSMDAAKSVTATFTLKTHAITATAGANGTIFPAGVTTVNHGESQSYTIAANTGYHIVAVTVDGASVGAVTSYTFTVVTGDHTIAATFAVNTYALNVSRNGTGTGLVTSNPAGIACGADCTETYNYGTAVTLTAAADASSTWTGWSGACSGASPTCTLSMDAAKSVTATFTLKTHAVTATVGANGTISPAGATMVNNGASQSYTIAANAGYHIVDVTVDGASVGAVTSYTFTAVTANHTIAATFAVNTYALNISRNGTGTGLVTSNPAGIACGADCAETFNYGTTVTLTAAADASSTWTGWSGACSGASPTCTLSMDAAKSVTATFADITKPAGSVSFAGGAYTSAGTVTLTLNATDVAGVTAMMFSWDGGVNWNLEEPYSTTKPWNLGLSDGLKTVYVKFKDGAGNWSDPYRLDLTLDTTGPALTVASYGPCTNNPALTISGVASDALSGLKSVTVNGTATAVVSGSFTRQMTLASGINTIVIAAEDNAGNVTTVNGFITWDQKPPALVVSAPEERGDIDGVTGSAKIDIQGTVDEGSVTIDVNGGGPETAPVSGSAFTYPVTLSDGSNTITVSAADCAGNISTVVRTVIYDKEKPVLSVTDPAGDTSTSQESITIRGSVSDLTGITLTIDVEGAIYPVAVDNGSFAQVITFTDQKSYRIEVTAIDETGHTSTIIRNIVYDQTKPALVIHPVTSPTNQNSQTISGDKEAPVTITVACPTAAVGAVTYPTATTWSVLLTGMSPGDNVISVTATDEATNQSTLTATITVDTTPPVTTVAVNGGTSRTNDASVTLSLTASADAEAMQFKNETGTWTTPETYSSTKVWTLSAGDGTKTVSAKVRDAAGNWSVPVDATITLDTVAPMMTVALNGGASHTNSPSVTLSLTASADAEAIQFRNETGTWTTPETYSSTKAWTLSAGDGTKTVSAKARDASGNWSAPVEATIALDTIPPMMTIAVNGGASHTDSLSVTLSLTASADAEAMQFKNETGTWTAPEAYSTSKSWTLSAGDGAKTVSAKVRDTSGNWSAPVAATITLDTAAPTMTVAINGGASHTDSLSVTLSLTASADAEAMQFKNETGTWTTPETYSSTKAWTLSAGDGTKTVSAKVRDTSGNWSAPVAATITLDTVAPVTTASPAGGFIRKGEAIALVSSEAATIYYTIDGSMPQTTSSIYAGPIPLSADTTVRFLARDLAGNMEATVRSAAYKIALPGDVNLSNKVDIADAILAIQLLSRMTPAGTVSRTADVDGDGKIGPSEVIYILQKAAGLR